MRFARHGEFHRPRKILKPPRIRARSASIRCANRFARDKICNEKSEGTGKRMKEKPALSPSHPRFLMCRPRHFAVSYRINPWMDPGAWADSGEALTLAAEREWSAYHRVLVANGAAIEFVPPELKLPDLVFTANAAVVLDRRVLLARFRHPERRCEEP